MTPTGCGRSSSFCWTTPALPSPRKTWRCWRGRHWPPAGQVNASTLVEEYPNDFTGIIGLHTYSQSPHREYDITMTGNWVERGGFRFQDFVLTRRKEVNTDGNH